MVDQLRPGSCGESRQLGDWSRSLKPVSAVVLGFGTAEIEQRVGLEESIRRTGNRALAGFTAPKLLWLAAHEPEAHARVEAIMLPKDYVRLRLCGERSTDVSDASGTLLFDVGARRWSSEMCEALEVPAEWLASYPIARAVLPMGLTSRVTVIGSQILNTPGAACPSLLLS